MPKNAPTPSAAEGDTSPAPAPTTLESGGSAADESPEAAPTPARKNRADDRSWGDVFCDFFATDLDGSPVR